MTGLGEMEKTMPGRRKIEKPFLADGKSKNHDGQSEIQSMVSTVRFVRGRNDFPSPGHDLPSLGASGAL